MTAARRTAALLVGLTLATLITGAPLMAQDAPADDANASQPAGNRPLPDDRSRVVFRDHPSLRLGRHVQIDLRAKMDVLHRQSPEDGPEASSFGLDRTRIGLEGVLFDRVEFQLERELDARIPWRDVYIDLRAADGLRVRGGKFKVPFSLDRLTSPTRLDFVNRSRIGEALAPGRAVGMGVHGRVWRRAFAYNVGFFAHGGDDARVAGSKVTGRTGAARFTMRPSSFFGAKPDGRALEIGVNATLGDVQEGLHSLRAQTTSGQPLADRVYVRGQRIRLGLDAAWSFRSMSVKSEILRMSDERLGQGLMGDDLPPLVAQGWYVSGSWVATGERKTADLEPRRPLFKGGVGAVEIAARLERIRYSSGSGELEPSRSPRAARIEGADDRVWTLGVNWYLNRWIKLQANLVRDELGREGAESEARGDWTRLVRMQFSM